MDSEYFVQASRYVALNPVRARLVAHAGDWPWSSVRAHLAGRGRLGPRRAAARVGARIARFFETDVGEEARQKL